MKNHKINAGGICSTLMDTVSGIEEYLYYKCGFTLIEWIGGNFRVMGIGRRIQAYREGMGLKQEELAEQVELSCNYLGAIEREVKTPSLDTLIRIINALEVSADEILEDVIYYGVHTKCSRLEEKMRNLPLTD